MTRPYKMAFGLAIVLCVVIIATGIYRDRPTSSAQLSKGVTIDKPVELQAAMLQPSDREGLDPEDGTGRLVDDLPGLAVTPTGSASAATVPEPLAAESTARVRTFGIAAPSLSVEPEPQLPASMPIADQPTVAIVPVRGPGDADLPAAATNASSVVDVVSQNQRYEIKPGDTLITVAQRVYGAQKYWVHIARANPTIDPRRLHVGQFIKLPVQIERDADVGRQVLDGAMTHLVGGEESLWLIAQQYYKDGAHWRVIYEANRKVIGGDPDQLAAGLKLTIPPLDGAVQGVRAAERP